MHLLGTVKSQWDFTKPGNLTSFVGLFYFWSRLTSNCRPSFLIPLGAGITGLCYLTWLHHLLVLGTSLSHSWLTSYPFLWCHNWEIRILQQFVDLLFLCLHDTWKSLKIFSLSLVEEHVTELGIFPRRLTTEIRHRYWEGKTLFWSETAQANLELLGIESL